MAPPATSWWRIPALTDDNKPNFPTIFHCRWNLWRRSAPMKFNAGEPTGFLVSSVPARSDAYWRAALQWEFFQPLTPDEFAKRFGIYPSSVRCIVTRVEG